jgi:hypothetical protein
MRPAGHRHKESLDVVDEPIDVYGAEPAAATLTRQIEELCSQVALTDDPAAPLTPAFSLGRDHVDGPPWAGTSVVLFGAYTSPSSRSVGRVLGQLREQRRDRVRLAWRHLPDPEAQPRDPMFALAAEAAATRGRFWALTYRLLALRHHDQEHLHAALIGAGLDPGSTLETMRAGTGSQRILDDVASARASGVRAAPAVFIDGERYRGDLDLASLSAALDAAAAHDA